MAETTGDNPKTISRLGFDTVLRGHNNGAPQSGIRVLEQANSREPNPLARVTHTIIDGREVCEQVFLPEALAPHAWKYYAAIDRKPIGQPVIPATGLLLDNGRQTRLIWAPREKNGFSREELLKLARERYPDSRVAVSFSFGNKPLTKAPTPEFVLKSASPASDRKIPSLIDYLGTSLDWNERVKIRTYPAGQQIAEFEGSLQEYLVK